MHPSLIGREGLIMNEIDKTARIQYRTKVSEGVEENLTLGGKRFKKKMSLRYGENPGYPAAFYEEAEASGANMARLKVLQEGSKGLSYINIADMDLGQRLVVKLASIYGDERICVLVKHEIPSGVAKKGTPAGVFEKAWNSDPLSNFGCVGVFSYTVDRETAALIVEKNRNAEVVYAPDFSVEALEVLETRKVLRVVKMAASPGMSSQDSGLEFKRLAGGLLVQQKFDSKIISADCVETISKKIASPDDVEAAIFNWNIAAFTRSNAVVIGTKDKVHGIGSGQRSRIDAAEDAVRFSKRGYGPEECVLASDAFMPFPDVVELAAANGIKAIIYPLGSVRDREVLNRADELGLAMIVTRRAGDKDSERCFLHR